MKTVLTFVFWMLVLLIGCAIISMFASLFGKPFDLIISLILSICWGYKLGKFVVSRYNI